MSSHKCGIRIFCERTANVILKEIDLSQAIEALIYQDEH
jgi:hypothetical protein